MALPVSYTTVSLMMTTLSAIGSISALNSSGISHHAGMAEALINAKISGRYSLPFTSTIPMLETLATDLGIYNVLSSRISLRSKDSVHPWYQRFKNAMSTLDDIADGRLPLVTSSGDRLSGRGDVGEVYSNRMNYHPTTEEIPVSTQLVDPDKIEDALDDRDLSGYQDRLT